MDRIEKILVFVVVATIVVIVTIALTNPGSEEGSAPGSPPARVAAEGGGGTPSGEGLVPLPAPPTPAARRSPAAEPRPGPAERSPAAGGPPAAAGPPKTAGPPAPPPRKASPPEEPRFYRVQKNDSLWKLAERFYGDGKYWTVLRDANKDVDPNLLVPGTVLVIPRLEKAVRARRTPRLSLPPAQGPYEEITLEKGQWLFSILRARGLAHRWQEVLKLNGLTEEEAARLPAGTKLRIPKR